MELFFTDLFVNGLPVNYGISRKEEAFCFEPVFNPFDHIEPPSFSLMRRNDRWAAEGTDDRSLIEQAIETIEEYLKLS